MSRVRWNSATVTQAAADLADEVGLDQLSMSLLAERLGVKTPSLYKHVDSLSALTHGIAVLGTIEIGTLLRDAMQGVAGRDALAAAAQTLRTYVREHPGRYAATIRVHPTGAGDPLDSALEFTLASFRAVLHGYQLEASTAIHALRMVRSVLHGYAALDASDAFQIDIDTNASFLWMIDFIDQGLRAQATT